MIENSKLMSAKADWLLVEGYWFGCKFYVVGVFTITLQPLTWLVAITFQHLTFLQKIELMSLVVGL